MLSVVRRVLDYEMTIAEWFGVAVLLATPYLVIGLIWSLTHTDRLAGLGGPQQVVYFLGSIVAWPVLLVPGLCPT
ncbi:hypothetical protein JDV09_06445 [Mycobacterium sp. Y57]|uniref:hypothetical protein n=1 Tax=Mycolicibacterium xanthum TaxID=2796469 RepID=UPI001C865B2C|nr:hypothetical protein [Mycolicibacterium xanthum]MBX7431749.1 hypothetical protein [Mycolicibacterium xanthum]